MRIVMQRVCLAISIVLLTLGLFTLKADSMSAAIVVGSGTFMIASAIFSM